MQDVSDSSYHLDVSIIIVSYNTREMTIECIDSVLKQTSTLQYEIIVVDNASIDGSVEAIRSHFPDIKLIASPANLGFARANNLAATHARGDRILLLNPDTVILDHAIDKLYEFAVQKHECHIWGGRTVFADGTLNPQSCWRRMTLWSLFCTATGLSRLKQSPLFNSEAYGGWMRDSIRAVDIVTGCFFLTDRSLWEQLRGFDPTFFMYGEEADFCLRARNLGAVPMTTPSATIVHYGGVSEPDQVDKQIKLLAAKITLMRRHWSRISVLAGTMLYQMLPVTKVLAYGSFGCLLRRQDFKHNARIWYQIWQNRRQWINGWDEVDAGGGAHNSFDTSASNSGSGQQSMSSGVSPDSQRNI